MHDGFRFQELIDLTLTICERHSISPNNAPLASDSDLGLVAICPHPLMTNRPVESRVAAPTQPEWAKRAVSQARRDAVRLR